VSGRAGGEKGESGDGEELGERDLHCDGCILYRGLLRVVCLGVL